MGSKTIHAHFDCTYVCHMCFIRQVQLGRSMVCRHHDDLRMVLQVIEAW